MVSKLDVLAKSIVHSLAFVLVLVKASVLHPFGHGSRQLHSQRQNVSYFKLR